MRIQKPHRIRKRVALLAIIALQSACTGETQAGHDARDSTSFEQDTSTDGHTLDATPADAQPTEDAEPLNDADAAGSAPDAADPPGDITSPEEDAGSDSDAVEVEPEDVAPLGRWQSYFNTPTAANGYEDQTLRDRLVLYLNGAVAGSEVRAHITELSSANALRPVVDALVNAHDRGVSIWMVHNGDANHFPELAARLGPRYVHCGTPQAANNTACLSNVDNGTHHMKNWYFSHTKVGDDDYRYMVIATSYNITVTQSRFFNDMLVVSGNQALYEAHVEVYEDYLQQRKTDDRYTQPHGKIFVPTAATYSAEFSPQKNGDMVADALARITQYEPGCTLGVGTLNLTRSAIFNQLERIKALGCQVRVVTGTALSDEKKARLDAAGIPHRQINRTRNGHTVSLHSKMMVYRGYYDTPVAQHPNHGRGWVWTGSQNFTFTPLKYRDDVFVGISRGGVTNNYSDYFEVMWANGT
ncbi:phospholipase D-like domain-containing protein [Bradymonas sediminis]|uniref:phospholipase D n=1 Tax=Bradymonas sediminis TaxID=1548548 RepID=A0A2Z4FMJ3_9DELT|nr:phospholipase D-like domain-containing protein [Bradymonas sediminis]AWV90189.1 hypothetical protein DN745_12935 [Bradymonas sediminis]TDP75844.1 phosphatidylserine/phosphatidylglycerophosphate/cardiolipin synthase-like enzyme [Bradymonas sediminis]